MKKVVFEERYFANRGEWLYFLSQIGYNNDDEHISDDFDDIDSITLWVDRNDIDIERKAE